VNELQDAIAAQPLSRVMLNVEGENGDSARIRMGVRGGSVGATIDMSNPVAARALEARIGDLQRALERQGLEPAALRVRSQSGLDGTQAVRQAAAAGEVQVTASQANGGATMSNGGQGGDTPQRETGGTRRDPDAQRQRSRKEQGKEGQ
jgi:hypothetical protein